MESAELRAGYAGGDITPEPGLDLGGYWGRSSGATDVHDALEAKVLVLGQANARAALVALDVVGLEATVVQQLRRDIEAKAGIAAEAVMVCCSHTHSGPLTLPYRGMGEMDMGYLRELRERVVELAARSAAALQPAALAHARVPVQLGMNRRQQLGTRGQNPVGPVVPYVHVVRIDGSAGQRATLFSHACHPVVLGAGNLSVSADFPGAAARWVEAETGSPALFVNGACGDIDPRITNGSFADVEALGQELGRAVVGGLDAATPLAADGLSASVQRILLPLVDPPALPRALVQILEFSLKAGVRALAGRGDQAWRRAAPGARLAWARKMLARAVGRGGSRHQEFEIQALRIGSLGLLGMEGEIFARYQLDLEASSPLQPTVFCGCANGSIGYVPTADEYERGGYEVEEAYRVYPGVQMIAPESEVLIREAAARALAALTGQ